MAYTDLSSYVPASYFFPGKINQEGWQLSFQALKKKPGRAWSHAVWLQISSASPRNNELMSRVFPHWRAAHQMGWVSPTDLIFFPSSRHGAAGSGKTQSLFLPVWSTSSATGLLRGMRQTGFGLWAQQDTALQDSLCKPAVPSVPHCSLIL